MKALVVGHRGYLGPLVVKHLKRGGAVVHGYDEDWYVDSMNGLKGEHIPDSERNGANARLFDMDPLGSYDVIVWLAAVSNDHMGDIDVFDTNWSNTEQPILQAKRFWHENPSGKFIYISSASVYGAGEKTPSTETSPENPLSAYGRSKLATDNWLRNQHHHTWVSLRLGTLWGAAPNMRRDLVVNAFVWESIQHGLISPKSDARRPILHVDDAALAISLAAFSPSVHGIINVCSENIQVYDLARRIGDSLGCRVGYGDGDTDQRDYHMDNSKAMFALEIHEPEWKTTANPALLWEVDKCLRKYGKFLPTRTELYKLGLEI